MTVKEKTPRYMFKNIVLSKYSSKKIWYYYGENTKKQQYQCKSPIKHDIIKVHFQKAWY